MSADIIKTADSPEHEATQIPAEDDRPPIGAWFWLSASESMANKDQDRPKQWLACVIEVGTNYAKLRGVNGWSRRVSLDDLRAGDGVTPEPDPTGFFDMKLAEHKGEVRRLMGEIQRVCHQLGVPMSQALTASETTSQALATTSGVANVKRYSKALVKAKDKTLPELFAKVKVHHEQLAKWMKAELIPTEAELTNAREVTTKIKDKIHTVELYAGLQEQLVQIRDGEPADANERVKLMQRRCYMDEECLANYDAGGMDFEGIEAFDKWIARSENMCRILPHERCIVAMRVRRDRKDYGEGDSLSAFIRFRGHHEANKWTFLYIRNGKQLWRMHTSIEFEENLFPRREDSDLLGDGEIYHHGEEFISGRRFAEKIENWKAERRRLADRLWQWWRAGRPVGDTPWTYIVNNDDEAYMGWERGTTHQLKGKPERWHYHAENSDHPVHRWSLLTPTSVYYDDATKAIARAAFEHNRIAVIVQGLLDRSTCLHPHAPWKLWTPEGFAAGIELVFDTSLALTPGEAPDWEGYRAQLNKSLRAGSTVIGARRAWREHMEDKYGEGRRHWPDREGDGPSYLDEIVAIRGGKAQFVFTRNRKRAIWVKADRPGYVRKDWPDIEMSWWCPLEKLTCIDAYTPGDYHRFFDDPRTRALYLQWAPILLTAENYHATRRTAPDKLVDGEAPMTIYEADPEPPKEKAMDDLDDDDDDFDDDDDDIDVDDDDDDADDDIEDDDDDEASDVDIEDDDDDA